MHLPMPPTLLNQSLTLPLLPSRCTPLFPRRNKPFNGAPKLRCSAPRPGDGGNSTSKASAALRTCKNCKTQFDPCLNDPRACRFHTAHFGGETKRKFESVYQGGTLDTPDGGRIFQYWHCCGSEDPFDPGCTASPHSSYDD